MLVTKFLQWQWAEIWISLHIGLSRTRAPKSWAQLGMMNNIHCVFIFHIYYIVTAMWLLVHFLVPLLFYFFLKWRIIVTNFIWTITPWILDWFQQSKWPPEALKKTFQTVPKMSQGNQYSLNYQQISQWSPSHQTLNHWYLRNCLT